MNPSVHDRGVVGAPAASRCERRQRVDGVDEPVRGREGDPDQRPDPTNGQVRPPVHGDQQHPIFPTHRPRSPARQPGAQHRSCALSCDRRPGRRTLPSVLIQNAVRDRVPDPHKDKVVAVIEALAVDGAPPMSVDKLVAATNAIGDTYDRIVRGGDVTGTDDTTLRLALLIRETRRARHPPAPPHARGPNPRQGSGRGRHVLSGISGRGCPSRPGRWGWCGLG